LEDQCVITRQVTVAGGVFAPGHLGELTQVVPFEMVDQALAATGTTQARIRVLPARVVGCLLLAGGLFAGLGYRQVWHKLTAALGALPVARPGDNALWQARARLGAAPLRWLFDLLRGPATACWITCCPTGGCGSAPASSNARSPNTRPEAPTSTGAATKPPSRSTSSPHQDLDTPRPDLNYRALGLARLGPPLLAAPRITVCLDKCPSAQP
jgi:Insertion element 4 transposase N-terminal